MAILKPCPSDSWSVSNFVVHALVDRLDEISYEITTLSSLEETKRHTKKYIRRTSTLGMR